MISAKDNRVVTFFLTIKENKVGQSIFCAFVVIALAGVCYLSTNFLGYKVVALILLLLVSALAMVFDIIPVLISAILSALIWNFFFIPPAFSFHIDNTEDFLMFLMYFVVASVNAVLTFKIRQAEKRARDKEEKEKTIKLYNTLLNSLSHELRTPISTIIGAVDTLKAENIPQNIQQELLDEIDTASVRLNRQVENLLNMSRLETGIIKLNFDWCDMNEIVFSVTHKLKHHQHQIQFTEDDKLPLFKLDRILMEQILDNIIRNAIQYTPEKTTIKIQVSHQQEYCMIQISDNGNGFPESEIGFAFDKFYRLPQSKVGGTGLGLSIAKGFVEAHQGNIQLQNGSEGGAEFTIRIPCETSYLNHLKNE